MSTHPRTSSGTWPDMSRRRFLQRAALIAPIGTGLSLFLDGMVSDVLAQPPCQDRWAHCVNCSLLFFDGDKDKGRCAAHGAPASGPHVAQREGGGIKPYYLAYDDSTGPGQGDWRFCGKCKVLFFNGYPDKGKCAGDGKGHDAAGFNFFLYHDRPARSHEEPGWRFCDKCMALFSPASAKAVCPADQGGHRAAGFRFVVGKKEHCIDLPCPQPACR